MTDTGKQKNNKGFTLVEIIISIGVLCLICGVIVQLFVLSGDVRNKAYNREMANLRAANTVELCKISDSPIDFPDGHFNLESTDFNTSKNSLVIREYFDEDWNEATAGKTPVFVIKTTIGPIGEILITRETFGENSSGGNLLKSGLFEIAVQAGYVELQPETEQMLVMLNTSKYYMYREEEE